VAMPNQTRDLLHVGGAELPHALDPTGNVALRFTDPPGALMQLVRPVRGTAAMAEWLSGTGLSLLFERFPHARDLRVILDMRHMTGRSASARAVLINAAGRCVGRVGHIVVLPSQLLGAAYLGVVEAGAALVRLSGLRVDIEHDLPSVLAQHGVRVSTGDAPRSPSN